MSSRIRVLNPLTLRWKFMLAPLLGVIAMLIVAFAYFSATTAQEEALAAEQNRTLFTLNSLSQLATRLAANHTHLYELLKFADKSNDEAKLYVMGKPFLDEVHGVEADTRLAITELPGTEPLLTALAAYRKQAINAVTMSTVDVDLAQDHMSSATSEFNRVNTQFLSLTERLQNALQMHVHDYHIAGKETLSRFGGVLLGVIVLMIVISLVLSHWLSHDLHRAIGTLGKLVGGRQTADNKSEVEQLQRVIEHVQLSHRQLDDALETLSKQETRLRSILDNALDGIITIDSKGIIEHFNHAAETMFGYTVAEAIGQNVSMLVPSPQREQHDYFIERYCATRQTTILGQARRLEGLRKDGSLFPLELSVNEMQVLGEIKFIGMTRDISQRVATEQELAQYQGGLEKLIKERTTALQLSNRELEAYSYSIAHDLRAPLRAIAGFSHVIKEDAGHKLNEEEHGHFDRIVKASNHMAELIDDILELGRVTRNALERSEVDLSALGKAAVEKTCIKRGDDERKIDWQIQEGMTTVGDRKLLGLLLDNLLGNACKYTSQKSEAEIRFGCKQTGDNTIYFVRDNGAGFDMKYADKLFTPFSRLHDGNTFNGTGIGLATVQRIVERHSGKVWVEAEVDRGACFYFTLGETINSRLL